MAEELQLGSAIGLQGTPKDYSAQFAAQAFRQQQAQQKRQSQERKASEKAYKMFDLKPGAMLKGREENTKNRLGQFYDNMSSVAANREDPKTNPAIQQSHAENLMHLAQVAKEREDFYKDLEMARANPDKYKLNEEVFNLYAGGKSYGDDIPYYQAGSLLIANGNPQKRIAELGGAIKPKIEKVDVINPRTGFTEQTDVEKIAPEDNIFWAETFYNSALNGTDIDGQVGLNNIKKNYSTPGTPLYDPKFSLMSPEQQDEIVKQKFIDEAVRGFEAVQAEKKAFNITRPSTTNINVNTGIGTDTTKPVGTGGTQINVIYTDELGGKKEGTATALDGFSMQGLNIKSTLPTDAINQKTNEPLKLVGSQDMSGGNVLLMYTYKKGTKSRDGKVDLSGRFVPDQTPEGIEKELEAGQVEAVPTFFANIKPTDSNELPTPFHAPAKDILKNVNVLGESGKEDKSAVIQMYNAIQAKADAENRRIKELSEKQSTKKTQEYKFTQTYQGKTYGRNSEKENWKLIR